MSKGPLLRQLSRISSVIGQLGPISGTRVLWSFYRHRLLPGGTPRPTLFPVPGTAGVWLRPGTADWHVYDQVFIRQDYDLASLPQYSKLLADYARLLASGKKPVIIDCGANIGLATVAFKRAFPEAVIYAIEPERENFELMTRNFAPLSNVFPLRAGVWDCKAALAITDPTVATWSFSLRERNKNDNEDAVDVVAAVTIPEILDAVPDGACFIVKIDIEGGESQLFRSNTAWLDNAALVIIEIHDWMLPWQATAATFFSAISRRKRDYFFRNESIFCFLHPSDALDADGEVQPGQTVLGSQSNDPAA
jgi:FkbM family methyltransferase